MDEEVLVSPDFNQSTALFALSLQPCDLCDSAPDPTIPPTSEEWSLISEDWSLISEDWSLISEDRSLISEDCSLISL
ncbi:hypothetical protein NHX12_012279 [Muraenolepis orangiensis]|uniref:Uncharacterized protein n=1 Tax=Muraenolepis orangiensis TaxID=630683 RepID=A0A9Q0DDU8_9TELE|nr:hypothetical protein NHX12_012279 [Muraenolepis orangiensis]